MTCRALLLVNPGARQGSEGVRELRAALEGHGFALVDDPDAGPERFPELIARHREDVDAVLAGGGDGTLNAAVQGLVGTSLPLGVLPLGTANNLARTLGIPPDIAAAAAIAARGHRRRIDLGLVNDRYFFTTASIGLSVQITEQLSSESKRRWGTLAYAVAAVRVLARAPRFHAEISWEGGTRRSRTLQIVVGNGRYYGQALAVAEDAAIDDARLDLYSLEVRHWWQLLGLLPALRRGSHGEHDRVEAIRGTAFEVRTRTLRDINIDGEVCLRTPATFRVVPGAIEVFAPTDGAG
ncbi:MAG: lipid kinase [Gemmatimonadales bacterium]|nr:lipid kinase [Gemmatimonadales bacterium]